MNRIQKSIASPSAAIIFFFPRIFDANNELPQRRKERLPSKMQKKKTSGKLGKTHAHFHIGIALHHLLDSSQRQWRMTVVGYIVFCSIDLPLPEGQQEVVQRLSGLNVWSRHFSHTQS